MNEHARSVIDALMQIQRTPLNYFGYPSHVVPFVLGFRTMASIVGLSVDTNIYLQVVRARGWKFRDVAEWISWERLKQQTNLDDKSIVDELLAIEVEAWRKTYQ